MVVGYTNDIVAEARYRVAAMFDSITEFRRMINDARGAEDYKYDATQFYVAANNMLTAIRSDFNYLNSFISANRDTLQQFDSIDYYEATLASLSSDIDGLESLVVDPDRVLDERPDLSFTAVVDEVVDGDTVVAGGRRVRFAAMDAAEIGTEQGMRAKKFLEDIILGKEIEFKVDPNMSYDHFGRVLAVPYLDGRDLNIELLKACMVKPVSKFGRHRYVDLDTYKEVSSRCVWPYGCEYKISSKPTHASIIVDGVEIDDITPTTIRLSPGPHSITLYKADHSSITFTIDARPGSHVFPEVVLFKLGDLFGLVEIRAIPTDVVAIVSVDGGDVGTAPMFIPLPLRVPSKIEVRADGYQPFSADVTAKPGEVVRVIAELQPL